MKWFNRRNIIKGILAIIAVANLILLFRFEYEILGFKWSSLYVQKDYELTDAAAQATTEASTEAVTIESGNNEDSGTGGSEEPIATEGTSTAESAAEENDIRKCRVISTKNARIRSGPGTEYERVTSFPRGTVLEVLNIEENGWVHVRADDGTEGYVSGDLVELIDE